LPVSNPRLGQCLGSRDTGIQAGSRRRLTPRSSASKAVLAIPDATSGKPCRPGEVRLSD
jgi:hypothetical protein